MKNGFDNVAFFYDALSFLVFGQSIRRAQTCYLHQLRDAKSILIVGGGTGWWLKKLRSINPDAAITYIDASAKMISRARANAGHDPRIEFIHGTQQSIPYGKTFDAIILFFFLDLFDHESAPGVVRHFRERLSDRAIWLVADFVIAKKWHNALLRIMYSFFRATAGVRNDRLPEWRKILRTAALQCVEERSFYGQFICASVWQ